MVALQSKDAKHAAALKAALQSKDAEHAAALKAKDAEHAVALREKDRAWATMRNRMLHERVQARHNAHAIEEMHRAAVALVQGMK